MDEFFKDLDRDYDERLTFGEFLGEESHIEKIFKNMDKNGDGFVTKAVRIGLELQESVDRERLITKFSNTFCESYIGC